MSANEAVIRPAQLADVAQLARVHTASWRETYASHVPERFFDEASFERRKLMWAGMISQDPPAGPIFVAEREDRLVGFASSGAARGPDAEKGFPPARDVQLFTIYVLAAEHGTGIGQRLLDAVVGATPAQLWVDSVNARAIAFYERNGFRADGVSFVDPRLDSLTELRMVR